MRSFNSGDDPTRRSAAPAENVPASCPTCKSASILTTAKTPDSTSYWRCTKCGDVWNDSRRQAASNAGYRWRYGGRR